MVTAENLDRSLERLSKTALRVKAERDQLVAEVREFLRNATYADGYVTALTQDAESLKQLILTIERG